MNSNNKTTAFRIDRVRENAHQALMALLNTSNTEEVEAAFGLLQADYVRESQSWVKVEADNGDCPAIAPEIQSEMIPHTASAHNASLIVAALQEFSKNVKRHLDRQQSNNCRE